VNVLDSLQQWHLRRMRQLTTGGRAKPSAAAGEPTMRYYRRTPNSFYPACTKHGALAAIGGGKWRCPFPGCNIGVEYPVEPQGQG
jgi:hypothetical protein